MLHERFLCVLFRLSRLNVESVVSNLTPATIFLISLIPSAERL